MINQLTLVGRIVRDAEYKDAGKGYITTFTLAVQKDEENAMFIPCKFYSDEPKLAKFLTKGIKVAIAGTINQDTWKDKDGNSHSSIYAYARYLEFCESKKESK